MDKKICPKAKECEEPYCIHKVPHEENDTCEYLICSTSDCIPYVEPSPEPSMPLEAKKLQECICDLCGHPQMQVEAIEAHDQQVRKAFAAWLKEECNQHKQYSGTSPEPCSYYLQRINCPECQTHLRAMAGEAHLP